MFDLEGKVALITGGGGGIGLGMAQAFLAAGLKVILADVDLESQSEDIARLDAGPDSLLVVRLDVTDPVGWEAVADEAERVLGPVQILCNNAGVTTAGYAINALTFEQQSTEDWHWAMNVNITGPFLGIRTILARLRRENLPGHIVNTASMAGIIPFPGNPPAYTASKYGLVGISELLRLDLRRRGPRGVGVSVLFPGHVRSRINDSSIALSPTPLGDAAESDFMRGVRQRNAAGADPRLVGERVLNAIRRDEFYIFSHPEYESLVRDHYLALLDSFAEPADPGRRDMPPVLR